jgi:hypothetical protein
LRSGHQRTSQPGAWQKMGEGHMVSEKHVPSHTRDCSCLMGAGAFLRTALRGVRLGGMALRAGLVLRWQKMASCAICGANHVWRVDSGGKSPRAVNVFEQSLVCVCAYQRVRPWRCCVCFWLSSHSRHLGTASHRARKGRQGRISSGVLAFHSNLLTATRCSTTAGLFVSPSAKQQVDAFTQQCTALNSVTAVFCTRALWNK